MTANDRVAEILAFARAGATSLAWNSFLNAELNDVADNLAALTLKGRLLKDQARRARGSEATPFYLQSAKAYAEASALDLDSYPLINAATMSLFAGQPAHMAVLAQQVLALLESGHGAGETPYWHEATKAEALLLLDQRTEAEMALRNARAHAPQAWEDHATTLRQFRAILAHRNESYDWLAAYAPPKSIYYKGMMGIATDDRRAADAIAALVAETDARFAYGALAAGADILIAEATVRGGGKLHVILPASPSVFKKLSVAPYGDDWLPRFDALMEQAVSVDIVSDDDRLSTAAIDLAALVAKGRAIDNAERLESEALPVEVIDSNVSLPGAGQTLRLARSASVGAEVELGNRQLSVLVATDSQSKPKNGQITAVRVPEDASKLVRQIRSSDPDATIAVHALIVDGDIISDVNRSQLERLMRAAAAGTVIVTSTAAMLIKATDSGFWLEPLGELPDPSGALDVYALGISA